jgi:hypothetical protein
MNRASVDIPRDALVPALQRTLDLVREMREQLGSWDRVEWWFADLVESQRVESGEGDAEGSCDFGCSEVVAALERSRGGKW